MSFSGKKKPFNMSSSNIENDKTKETLIKKVNKLEFILQDTMHQVNTNGLALDTTLNDYIRHNLRLTGTKKMCEEGGCGVCMVSAEIVNPKTNVKEIFAINSCLVSIFQCSGWNIKTIEALGNRNSLHIIQKKMIENNATQCGFCTPGMIMTAYTLQQSGKMSQVEIENSLGGNMCRCTGYRPILSALRSIASDKVTQDKSSMLPDIEEIQFCKRNGCEKTCPTPCFKLATTPFYYDHGLINPRLGSSSVSDKIWYKVSSIPEVFSLLETEDKTRSYRFVAGNTAKGVFYDMDKKDFYIDIANVPDLRGYTLSTKALTIGGNCTLTEFKSICKEVSGKDDGFKHLMKIADHLDIVAIPSIRNIGTIAGNLMMKYTHNEFVSDIFLLLEVLFAKIIVDNGYKSTSYSPASFLNTNLAYCLIRQIEIPPLDNTYFLETYKVMPRAQNAHANVNAGFLLRIRNGIVKTASIVYGGINSNFIHATFSENYLKNKHLFDNKNLKVVFSTLDKELQPDHVLPDTSPQYRKQLAISLFYKYVLSIADPRILSANVRSGASKLTRSLSTSTQDIKDNTTYSPIGVGIHKLEAVDQVTGSSKYTYDLPDLDNQRHAVFVYAFYPAGSIVTGLDAEETQKIKGVEKFFQAEDIPGINSFVAPTNDILSREKEPIFIPIGESLKFYGQPVGMIVAETRAIAVKAAAMVKVTCKVPETSPLLNVKDVLSLGDAAKDRIVHINTIVPSSQDMNAEVQFKGTFNIGSQAHFSMETQICQVIPTDDGGLLIHPSTQWIFGIQFAVSQMLNVPTHKIVISMKRVGGSFGGKLTRANWLACAASLAAHTLNRPVRMHLSIQECMNIIGKRHPTYNTYEVGTDRNGKIKFLDMKIFSNTGCYANAVVAHFTLNALTETYISTSFDLEYNYCTTDIPSSTWTRTPGTLEGIAMLENVLEDISYKTGKDPLDVRMANLNEAKHPLLKKMLDEFVIWSSYRERRKTTQQFNALNRWKKKGLAIMPFAMKLSFPVSQGVQICIYITDGTVAVKHGGIEIGQGINTKVAQAVAYEFQIPLEMVHVLETDSFTSANNFATGGSLTTENVCRNVRLCCDELKERIETARISKKLPENTPWLQLVQNAHAGKQNLIQNSNHFPDESNDYPIYGVSCVEVEIDLLTGLYQITRADLMEDAGDSSNPFIDLGQVEGAFMMALGYWTQERIIYDHDGQNMTNRTWTYKPPGPKDIPCDFRVKIPTGNPNPKSIYHNKATSEPPACLAFATPMAINDALRTAKTQSNPAVDPWTPIDGSLTVDTIFMNSLPNPNQYRL